MPRKARITVPGAVHHVMSRGIEGKPIFRSDEDRYLYLNLLEKQLVQSGYLLYAWCLMDNHYHLLLRVNDYPLGRFMRQLNGQYAHYFRKKSAQRGYLFQDRYKSIVTQDQLYIEELVRYVHLNPVRAGVCPDIAGLNTYRWSGHAVIMGKHRWNIQNVKDVLSRFDKNQASARRKYCVFLQDGMQREPDIYKTLRASNAEKENARSTGSWVIGNREFVVEAMEQHGKNVVRATIEITVDDVAEDVCQKMEVSLQSLQWKGRGNASSKARRIISYICTRKHGIPTGEIARYFGVTSSAVSNMVRDGEVFASEIDGEVLSY